MRWLLPKEMREELKKPFGTIEEKMEISEKIITVGDLSTYEFLKKGGIPKISIIDKKEKREPITA